MGINSEITQLKYFQSWNWIEIQIIHKKIILSNSVVVSFKNANVHMQLYFQKMLNTYKLLPLINWFYSQALDDVLTLRINNKYFFLYIPHPWYYHDFIRKIWTMKLLGVHVETSWHCSNGLFSQLHMMFPVPTCGAGNNFNNFKHENKMRFGSPSTFSYFLVLNICTPRIKSTS